MATLPKCVVLGSFGAGKTCLVRTYIDKTFKRDPPATVCPEYESSNKLILCEVPASDYYAKLRRLCYPNTNVFLICFSVVDPNYSDNIREYYVSEIRKYCPMVPRVLVGTKVDLREDEEFLNKRKVTPTSYDQGKEFAEEIEAIEYMECSALKGTGISAVFNMAAACGLYYRTHCAKAQKGRCSLL